MYLLSFCVLSENAAKLLLCLSHRKQQIKIRGFFIVIRRARSPKAPKMLFSLTISICVLYKNSDNLEIIVIGEKAALYCLYKYNNIYNRVYSTISCCSGKACLCTHYILTTLACIYVHI